MPLEVPPLVEQRALANGQAGRRWLDALPDVLVELAGRWDLQIGAAYRGGTSGLVVAARDGSGRECALKVAMPLDPGEQEMFARSVLVHRFAAGRGCAELLAHDDSVPAMLLERLGPNLHDLDVALPDLLETVATTLRTFWRPMSDDIDLPTGADKAEWLARYITTTWDELDQPCDRLLIDRALELCDERGTAFDPATAVLVHADAHGWNTLDAGAGTFKFVDPEGLWSEPEHDLAVAMREYNEPLLAGETARLVWDRAELLASWCDADARRIWEWGYIERVSTGLANARDFGGDHARAFFEVARLTM